MDTPLHSLKELFLLLDSQFGFTDVNSVYATLLFDYLVVNADRHWGNISVLATHSEVRLAPIFDNAQAISQGMFGRSVEEYAALRKAADFSPLGSEQVREIANLTDAKFVVNYVEFFSHIDLSVYRKWYPSYLVDQVPFTLDNLLLSCEHPNIVVI